LEAGLFVDGCKSVAIFFLEFVFCSCMCSYFDNAGLYVVIKKWPSQGGTTCPNNQETSPLYVLLKKVQFTLKSLFYLQDSSTPTVSIL